MKEVHAGEKPQRIEYPKWQRKPSLLTTEEMKNPTAVLESFFETYSLPDCREQLWHLLTAATAGGQAEIFTARDAGDWLFFYRRVEELIEACWVMRNCKLDV